MGPGLCTASRLAQPHVSVAAIGAQALLGQQRGKPPPGRWRDRRSVHLSPAQANDGGRIRVTDIPGEIDVPLRHRQGAVLARIRPQLGQDQCQPYLRAFVPSSCRISASRTAGCGVSQTSGPSQE